MSGAAPGRHGSEAPPPPDLLRSARLALDDGDAVRAFDAARALLAEAPWSVALLKSVGDLLARLAGSPVAAAAAPAERVAVLGGGTTGVLLPAVRCALAEEGRLALLYEGPFGAFRQEILDPASGLHAFAPDTVLVVRSRHELEDALPRAGETAAEVEARLAAEAASFDELWGALLARHRCRILQHDLELPELAFVGPAERTHPASAEGYVAALNSRLREVAAGRVAWLEVERASRRAGTERWSPAELWALAKLPVGPSQLAAWARLFQGAWRLAAGRARKALVTDLDYTLWGGVAGDDGTEGIVLGPGSAAGEGYLAFARYLVELRRRGVVLAVCSRNDPEVAARPFREHRHMPLRQEDFAVFHCSWDDKATGLRRIAAALNLGLDALVLVDDNPAECAQVRREVPEVVAVHLSGDPSSFAWQLESRHLFDRAAVTAEDLGRGEAYRVAAETEKLRTSVTDVDAFLRDLRMEGELQRATGADLDRVAQLEAKTNQFNLTTPRFTKAEIAAFAEADDHEVLAFRLRDRFTDHGLVSALVTRRAGDRLELLSWTLSCRVFSRGAEAFVLERLLERCRARSLAGIETRYRPTPKNGVVADLLPRLGFRPTKNGSWFLPADAAPGPHRIAERPTD
jgi:FkbH-like protein